MILWGILAAVACALCAQVAGLCKHRGANAVDAVSLAHPVRAIKALMLSRWFMIGMGMAVVAYGFHVAAIAFAPISWVQAILAAGVVSLAVIADRIFGYSIGPRQWAGIGFVGAGLTMFAVTVPSPPAHDQVTIMGLLILEVTMMIIGIALLRVHKYNRVERHGGMVLGMVAGIFMALGSIAVKAGMSGASPLFLLLAIACAAGGFFASARGFQLGDAVPVLTSMSLAANVVSIVSGWVAFGETLPSDVLPATVHLCGFAMLIAAAWLIPGARCELATAAR